MLPIKVVENSFIVILILTVLNITLHIKNTFLIQIADVKLGLKVNKIPIIAFPDLDPLTVLKIVGVWSKHLRIFLRSLRQSSVISGKCSETFLNPSDNFSKIFGKWSEIFGKSSKTSLLARFHLGFSPHPFGHCVIFSGKKVTVPPLVRRCPYAYDKRVVEMEVLFSCLTLYLASERSERVRYQVEH